MLFNGGKIHTGNIKIAAYELIITNVLCRRTKGEIRMRALDDFYDWLLLTKIIVPHTTLFQIHFQV